MTGHQSPGRRHRAFRSLHCDAPGGCLQVFDGVTRGASVVVVREVARGAGWSCRNPGGHRGARDLCPEHVALAAPSPLPHAIGPDGELLVDIGDGLVAIIDPADLSLITPYAWRPLTNRSGTTYAAASGGGATNATVYMHRLIAGAARVEETDHRNGDGLDNRRANLRRATPSQNRANAGKPRRPDGSAHSSRYKGVTWSKKDRNWQSKISSLDSATGRTRSRSLGRYSDEAAAARAYDAAALATWGEFAWLNFPAIEGAEA